MPERSECRLPDTPQSNTCVSCQTIDICIFKTFGVTLHTTKPTSILIQQ